jgi:hypothetical protein
MKSGFEVTENIRHLWLVSKKPSELYGYEQNTSIEQQKARIGQQNAQVREREGLLAELEARLAEERKELETNRITLNSPSYARMYLQK